MTDKKKIHFVGIGGVGMGTFAVALAEYGHTITGSDGKLYEPMKGVLESAKITLLEGFEPSNVEKVSPDLVVIGNVVRKDNPEVRAWLQTGTKFMSFPEAVRIFLIGDKTSVVCAGTHGKTTTSSWVSFLLEQVGLSPSYLIGGVPADLPRGCRLNDSKYFVCEGDEYDSAFFDKGPKFLHYHPSFCILANIEFDHADIYKDLAHVQASFEKLVSILPGDGLLIARYDDPVVMAVAGNALCPVQTFGTGPGAMWKLGKVDETREGFEFEVIYKNRSVGTFKSPLFGEHNLLNLLSGIIAAVNLGVPMDKIRPVTANFHGAKRRQEVLLETPITIVDDFAHHPTEVAATVGAVRKRFPTGKLWALFEPRSATARRAVHQAEYPKAFAAADHIRLSTPFKAGELADAERFSSDVLATALRDLGKDAAALANADAILEDIRSKVKEGDTILVMSNGEFDKIQKKLLTAFAK
jgi:UDP-N-acetylmuramate: L-alanyl-gamma-D-glutamyl-meso-diaminopimelate ligase